MSGNRCPVALAFKRTLGVPEVFTVSLDTEVRRGTESVPAYTIFDHSEPLRRAIVRYDFQGVFKPATFIVKRVR